MRPDQYYCGRLTCKQASATRVATVVTILWLKDGCERSWGLCLTSEGKLRRSLGSYYTDLPSNILGSFIMGAVGTSAAVGLSDKKVCQYITFKAL